MEVYAYITSVLSQLDLQTLAGQICSRYLSTLPITTQTQALNSLRSIPVENGIIQLVTSTPLTVQTIVNGVLILNPSFVNITTPNPNTNDTLLFNFNYSSGGYTFGGIWQISFDTQTKYWSMEFLLQQESYPGSKYVVYLPATNCAAPNQNSGTGSTSSGSSSSQSSSAYFAAPFVAGNQFNAGQITNQSFQRQSTQEQIPAQVQAFTHLFTRTSNNINERLVFSYNGQNYEVVLHPQKQYVLLRNGQLLLSGQVFE